MRNTSLRILRVSIIALLAALPAAARADFGVEASLGKGAKLAPSPVQAEPLNLMVAPGYQIMIVRLSLGLVADFPDVENRKFDIQLRPMVAIVPPVLPVYGRVIFAITNLLNSPVTVQYGAAVGFKVGLGPIGVFAEAGLLPTSRASQMTWLLEGRLGAAVGF